MRTESSALSSSPEFLARTFVLRLAQPLANTLAPQALLQVNLYAAPSVDSPNGGDQAEIPVTHLITATATVHS